MSQTLLPRAAATTALRVEVVARLGEHAGAWDALTDAAPLTSPFLRSWWVESLAATRDTRVLLVLDGATLVGGLALQQRRVLGVRVLETLGQGVLCPDHLDLLAAPGREDDVVAALRGWLQRPGSRLIDLDGLVDGARALRLLPAATPAVADGAPYEPLPADPAAYLAARGSQVRTKAGKGRRRLDRTGLELTRTPDADVPAALDALEALHTARGDRGALLAHRDELRRFVLAGLAAGEVRVYQALRGDDRLGVLVGLTTGGRWSTYQLARSLAHDVRDVGTLLHLHAALEVCAEGFTELDLLRGVEPYKATLATGTRALLRVRAARGARARALLLLDRAARRALRTVRSVRTLRTRVLGRAA